MRTTHVEVDPAVIMAGIYLAGYSTRKAFCLAAGIGQPDFSNYTTGRRPMPMEIAEKISATLGIPLEVFARAPSLAPTDTTDEPPCAA